MEFGARDGFWVRLLEIVAMDAMIAVSRKAIDKLPGPSLGML